MTVGSLDAASGPAACRFFLRPTRVVGGGGSYFGLSFYRKVEKLDKGGVREFTSAASSDVLIYLLILSILILISPRRATAHSRVCTSLKPLSVQPHHHRLAQICIPWFRVLLW